MERKSFALVFLAVLLALVLFSVYRDYSQSHMLVVFRKVGGGADYFQANPVRTPFHQYKGYLYMIPLYRERDEDGLWLQEWGTDAEVDSGRTLLGLIRGDEDSRLQYIIVCSDEKLETAEAVRRVDRDPRLRNSVYFGPYNYLPKRAVLECRIP